MNLQESVDDIRAKLSAFISGGETKLTEANAKIAELTKATEAAAAKLTQSESDLIVARASVASVTKERDTAAASVVAKDKEISDLKAAAQSIDALAAEKAKALVAAQGIPTSKLPEGAPAGGTQEQQIEALQKQLATETNPEKNYELAKQINDLRFGKTEKK